MQENIFFGNKNLEKFRLNIEIGTQNYFIHLLNLGDIIIQI